MTGVVMSDNSRRSRPKHPERNAPSDWSEADENWLACQMDQDDAADWLYDPWLYDPPEDFEIWYDQGECRPTGASRDFGDDCDADYFDW